MGRAGICTRKSYPLPRGSVETDRTTSPVELVSPKTEHLFHQKECLKEAKNLWAGLSAGRLVRSEDQLDPCMPTYIDTRLRASFEQNEY